MSAMVAPHVDSVQSSTPTAWRAARGRSARGFGQKRTWFEMCTDGARGSARRPRGPATLPPPPAHTLTASRPPQNRVHERTDMRRRTPRLRNSELAPAGRRGARAPWPRRRRGPGHAHYDERSHPRPTHAARLRIETAQAREPVEGPVPRLRGRRRHPRHQAQRQEGGRALRQDHVAHQEALLRLGQQVHQAERATSEREMNLNL